MDVDWGHLFRLFYSSIPSNVVSSTEGILEELLCGMKRFSDLIVNIVEDCAVRAMSATTREFLPLNQSNILLSMNHIVTQDDVRLLLLICRSISKSDRDVSFSVPSLINTSGKISNAQVAAVRNARAVIVTLLSAGLLETISGQASAHDSPVIRHSVQGLLFGTHGCLCQLFGFSSQAVGSSNSSGSSSSSSSSGSSSSSSSSSNSRSGNGRINAWTLDCRIIELVNSTMLAACVPRMLTSFASQFDAACRWLHPSGPAVEGTDNQANPKEIVCQVLIEIFGCQPQYRQPVFSTMIKGLSGTSAHLKIPRTDTGHKLGTNASCCMSFEWLEVFEWGRNIATEIVAASNSLDLMYEVSQAEEKEPSIWECMELLRSLQSCMIYCLRSLCLFGSDCEQTLVAYISSFAMYHDSSPSSAILRSVELFSSSRPIFDLLLQIYRKGLANPHSEYRMQSIENLCSLCYSASFNPRCQVEILEIFKRQHQLPPRYRRAFNVRICGLLNKDLCTKLHPAEASAGKEHLNMNARYVSLVGKLTVEAVQWTKNYFLCELSKAFKSEFSNSVHRNVYHEARAVDTSRQSEWNFNPNTWISYSSTPQGAIRMEYVQDIVHLLIGCALAELLLETDECLDRFVRLAEFIVATNVRNSVVSIPTFEGTPAREFAFHFCYSCLVCRFGGSMLPRGSPVYCEWMEQERSQRKRLPLLVCCDLLCPRSS
jgi:hypothetical protein